MIPSRSAPTWRMGRCSTSRERSCRGEGPQQRRLSWWWGGPARLCLGRPRSGPDRCPMCARPGDLGAQPMGELVAFACRSPERPRPGAERPLNPGRFSLRRSSARVSVTAWRLRMRTSALAAASFTCRHPQPARTRCNRGSRSDSPARLGTADGGGHILGPWFPW